MAASIPGARFEIMPGQTHMINAKALAPLINAILDERSGAKANETRRRWIDKAIGLFLEGKTR